MLERTVGDRADVRVLLDFAHVVAVDGSEGSRDSDTGAAWLDGKVVAAGKGRQAFAVLRGVIPVIAARRGSAGIDDWRQWLREAGLSAHSDPRGVLAARRQAADDAVSDYRRRVAAGLDLLPLSALVGATPVEVEGLAEGIRVRRSADLDMQDNIDRSEPLLRIVRRESRVLVVGQPGSGKTVALYQVAAFCAAHSWAPVPLIVPLGRLAARIPHDRPTPLTMSELVELATPGCDELLRFALGEHIASGTAILLLDAFDETLDARDRVVEHLRSLLDEAHPDLDVLMSSRYTAAITARSLRLIECALDLPWRFDDTIDRVVTHLAPAKLSTDELERWLDLRRERVRRSREEEPALWSVPMLAVLAAARLVDREAGEWLGSRSTLVKEMIGDSVRRWTAHRRDAALPGVDPATAPYILLDTFADIASVVVAGGAWHKAKERVADRLTRHWHTSAGLADGVSEAIIEYWDATASVFVTDRVRGPLTARTRLFAEIGDAIAHVREDHGVRSWLERVADDRESWETGRLAAGLSPVAASHLIQIAVDRGGELLDVATAAWADGAEMTAVERETLFAAQLDRLRSLATPESTVASSSGSSLVELAVLLAQLPLSDTQVEMLLHACASLDERQLDLLAALAWTSRASFAPSEPDSWTLDLIEAALVTDTEIAELEQGNRSSGTPRVGVPALVGVGLRVLLPARPEVAARLGHTGFSDRSDTAIRIETEFDARGLSDHIPRTYPWQRSTHAIGTIDLKHMLASMNEPFEATRNAPRYESASLTPSQAWHLDEAGALFELLKVGEHGFGDRDDAVSRFERQTLDLVQAVAEAADLPMDVVVAQLNQVRSEVSGWHAWLSVLRASSRLRARYQRIRPEHVAVALDCITTGNQWLARVAHDLCVAHGALDDAQANAISAELLSLQAQARQSATHVLAALRPDVALPSDDPATVSWLGEQDDAP
ncbi:NACHT domain-containing protein [Lentzea atacamensis]|nr:hypothetical protein [Lentzea atacamensis]